ncbi:MAG: LigC protein, partial [Halothiobacillaceae bacterium]
MTVSNATLQAITLFPSELTLAVGTQQTLQAIGSYSDGTSFDITSLVSWASGNPEIATVDISGNHPGLVTAVAPGGSTLSATWGSVVGSAQVTVSNATLEHITLIPATAELAVETTLQLQATGHFSDKSEQDLTTQASWSSTANNVAAITATGLLSGVAAGNTTITAVYAGVAGSTPVTVHAAALTRLEITPTTTVLPVTQRVQLDATGLFANGVRQTLTQEVHWSSSDSTVASVDNATATKGEVTAHAAGTVTLTASLGSVMASVTLSVTAAPLERIEVTTRDDAVSVGSEPHFFATGYYSDGTQADLSEQVAWSFSDSSVAVLLDNRGRIKTKAVGVVQIRAALGAVSAFAPLTVTSATLQNITLGATTTTLVLGTTIALTAVG